MTYRDVLLPRVVDPSSLWHSKISYSRNFPLPSSQSEVCKRLPAGFDPSAPRNSKITYRNVLLSSKENCKDKPHGVEFSSVRRSKISYTRDFLLSLRELEACKRLPGGFDPLTRCEVDGSCSSLFDTHKISSSLLSHESGVSRCGSSSSARRKSGDGSHYSPHSRYFRQFAGKSDKPNGPPSSDKEVSEGGRASNLYAKKAHSSAESLSKERVEDEKTNEGDGSHYGRHSKYIRQFAGHNRLLGSGPNLFQSTASTSAAKPEAQLQYELRKSDNPYHHPNSYKEAPKAGRASEICAKEAHSSAESLNKERVVDEKTKEGTATSKLSGFPLSVPVVVLKYALLCCIKIVALLALVFRIAKITYRDVLFSFKEIRKDHRRRPRGLDLSSSRHSKFSYTRDFLLSLSQLEVCKRLPAGFNPSTPRSLKITYRDVLLSIKEIRKDRHHGADLSWHSKISYTRDFLLSLSELEVCKRLPGGFNPSTSCEVDAAWTSLFDMQKISGSLLSHVSRVSRCGSSSSARCESGNSPRSSGGKRDSQSSGSNNQHRRSQGDCGSGDGSHYGPHSQYFRQFAGHNGLLGSGSNLFQCTAGILAPKPEAQLQYELRKSDNPYRHPYYYKEAPQEGRASDLYAEEAHSSAESLNKERVEDEKTEGGTVIAKLSGFPFSVADDTFSYFSDEYPCTVTNSRGIKPGNFSGITEVDNNESYDDDWAAIVSMLHVEQESRLSSIPLCDQMSDSTIDDTLIPQKPMLLPEMAPNLRSVELKLHPIPNSNELASEYCLPDEDSLISFDDLIIPQHSVSTSGRSLSRDYMWPLLVTTEVSDTYLAQNVMPSNARSTVPGYYSVTHRGNLYHDQQSQQSYPQFSHSQTNMGLPSFDALYSHQAQMNCQPKVIGPMTSCGTSPLKPHFNAQCRPSGSKAKSKKKDLLSCYSVLQQPIVLPCYQQNELIMGPSLPNYEAQMTSFAPGFNPVQMWPSIYQQPGNEGFRLPNPDPSGGVGYGNQVSYNNFT
ncbi:hypothetical protein Vadar_016963 [Vaccinium darrowii]|uniref:Uncharacterized protein n=1 Tax=Vaccinium darrowii TaxID=229202 RepID=A0ACB7YMH5_9ERIC|nr:hypothetical protein Vadar_016963 [Vaccinium darrowii]